MRFISRRTLVNLSLILVSICFALLIAEAAVRIFAPQPVDWFYFKEERTPGEVYERWGGIEVRINSHGERDLERTVEKPPGVYRVCLIGDSIAYGTGVSIEDSYGLRLERALNAAADKSVRFEVLNFTQGGNAPAGYLEMLRNQALAFDPDLVLIGFTLNDIEPLPGDSGARTGLYAVLTWVHARMRLYSHLYFLVFERSRATLYRSGWLDKSVRYSMDLAVISGRQAEYQAAWQRAASDLEQIERTSEANGARFAIVVFPYEMQLNEELLALYRDAYGFDLTDTVLAGHPQELLRQFAEKQRFVLVDLLEPFRRQSDRGLFFRELGGQLDFVHPNAAGHEIAAQVMFDSMRCSSMLPETVRQVLPHDDCADIPRYWSGTGERP